MMKEKFLKVIRFLETIATFLLLAFLGLYLYNFYKSGINDINKMDFKGGIQNHLVWSIKGTCYFVKPETSETVRLVPVEDCDKK